MSRLARLLMFAPVVLALSGFGSCSKVVREPVEVRETLLVYVPIPRELRVEKPIPEGPLRQCPVVAKQREADLLACYANLRAIGDVQGTRATEPAAPLAPQGD
jgi:hypothetical protein